MPRPTSKQLQEARRAKKIKREEAARIMQEKQEAARKIFEDDLENSRQKKSRLALLVSATDALYKEIDKLNKKAPAMSVSDLTLDRVNKSIKSVKALMDEEDDDFIDEINEFLAAGDMPEYRDVSLILSQLRQGLQRFRNSNEKYWRELEETAKELSSEDY